MVTKTKIQASGDEVCDRVLAASIDGRCHNIRYRQNQLHSLHAYLRTNMDAIVSAIQQDYRCSEVEALSEAVTSIQNLSELYYELDFEGSLKREYGIVLGKSDLGRRVPYGTVVIRPGQYSRFFSIIAPVAAAVAAGNCVLVELPNTLLRVDKLVKEAISVMDRDAFLTTGDSIINEAFLAKSLIIDQTSNTISSLNSISSAHEQLSIAVVHRTANMLDAARSICTARFRSHGSSPFAPDLVLVNEWGKRSFVQACLQCITEEEANLATLKPRQYPEENSFGLSSSFGEDEIDSLYVSSRIQFVELRNWSSIAQMKTTRGRVVVMISVTGLVDAVTVASKLPSILACFAFASLPDANFLSKHISSDMTFVNEIPPHMLVGPVVPRQNYASESDLRYDTFMMSKPHPEFVKTTSAKNVAMAELLSFGSPLGSDGRKKIQQIKDQALVPLKPTGQASGTSMGFFDQGIITGVAAFVLPTLCVIGYGVFVFGKMAYKGFY